MDLKEKILVALGLDKEETKLGSQAKSMMELFLYQLLKNWKANVTSSSFLLRPRATKICSFKSIVIFY